VKRVVFLPDRDVEREGDIFLELVKGLGIENYGRERASKELGERVRTGPVDDRVYVLPSTAPEHRGRFYEGVWRSFAARVLGRDLAVRDEFKGMAPEAIKAELDARRFPFGVLVANLVYDFNLGTVIRNANAFLAREVFIYGRKKADLRGAMGAHVYENVVHVPDLAALEKRAADYTLVCFEEAPGAVPLAEFEWPENPLMMFGQEGPGVPAELRDAADHTVVIPTYGSMRSINVGVVAGIAMYAWHSRA
jgi:tRNA(Leu) C34 or U34 (ribose-2'-O)-methylase TrmL